MAIKPLLKIEKALDDQGLFVKNRSQAPVSYLA
jgi:hypothetical protein